MKKVYADITNKALQGSNQPQGAEENFASRIAILWRTAIILGGLAFLLYFIWGGIEWITAGGDQEKIKTAQNKLTQGIIGLAILAASYVIIKFIGQAIGIDILNINWPTAG